jgi:N-acetylmuramoyl-L-alanine amidase
VVLDPGHGGDEQGALGSGGLSEKALNLEVARKTEAILEAQGIETLLTRSDDYRATLDFRVALAKAANPRVMVSIHHNADPDGPRDAPGTETYYQFRSAESKRLAGLIYEEVLKDLDSLDVRWVGDTDAGAKWRLNSRGGDYYGILRASGAAGVVTVMAELAFLSNASEEALLSRPEVQELEARALARGIERYLESNDPGSGFTTPYPRQQPAGPGGGAGGCVDPA